MRAAVYARLSNKKHASELGANIEDQKRIGVELVERRGWQLVAGEPFVDDGKGAYQDDARRPAWESMLATKPDVIVVRDVERLGRHPREYVALLDSKARVIEWLDEETADVRWDAQPVNPDTDEFQQRTVGARSYSRKIGTKVKRKLKVKAAAGAWPHGGTRPFGYHHPPQCCEPRGDDCQPGAVIESEASVIREIADRWLAGESLSSLCRDLTARGILTPKGLPWQYARLRQMLSGPRIAGIRVHNGVETKGQWKPIVSEELHRQLVTAASESMVTRANESGTYLLTSIAWCGRCGQKMYGLTQRSQQGARVRYVCRGEQGCGLGIAGPATDGFVGNMAFLSILAPELRGQEVLRAELTAVQSQVDDYRTRIKELDEAYWQARTIDKERWLTNTAMLSSSLADAERREVELRQQLHGERDLPTTAEELAARWKHADTRGRNALLRVGVERVVVHPAQKVGRFDPTRIEIHYKDGRVARATPEDLVPESFFPG